MRWGADHAESVEPPRPDVGVGRAATGPIRIVGVRALDPGHDGGAVRAHSEIAPGRVQGAVVHPHRRAPLGAVEAAGVDGGGRRGAAVLLVVYDERAACAVHPDPRTRRVQLVRRRGRRGDALGSRPAGAGPAARPHRPAGDSRALVLHHLEGNHRGARGVQRNPGQMGMYGAFAHLKRRLPGVGSIPSNPRASGGVCVLVPGDESGSGVVERHVHPWISI